MALPPALRMLFPALMLSPCLLLADSSIPQIEPHSSINTASLYQQSSTSSLAIIRQSQSHNANAIINQQHSHHSDANLHQTRSHHSGARISQDHTDGATGNVQQNQSPSSRADIEQSNGSNIDASIAQYGSGNDALIAQSHMDSRASIEQHSTLRDIEGSAATILQSAGNSSGKIIQFGVGNHATVHQF
ncbi:hypothetical protein [Alcanivorax sp.]|uniref:hypothetical protein n=1 Tax=Alcanivorax sp. TaxID=1872427 RepID=UPI000C0FEF6C|nr:hypothetical protein [Alcanivorax sp.]PHR67489.1 MAG: hypothetical protein COA55_06330 [Alcanivorax sp.]